MKIKRKTKKQPTPPEQPDWIEPILVELRKREGIKRLQGNPGANIMMIAPRPGVTELQRNLVWCDMSAVRFFTWLENQFGLKSNEDFLMMPCTFDGKNPKKANTDLGQELLKQSANEDQIERYIVVGGDAFKVYFGYGRKALMESLAGNILYLQQSDFKPVFVFPDLWALNFDPDMRGLTKREYAKARALCAYYMQLLTKFEPAFRKFLNVRQP